VHFNPELLDLGVEGKIPKRSWYIASVVMLWLSSRAKVKKSGLNITWPE